MALLARVVQIAQPKTILHWHRAGFRNFWRWKCRKRVGRPRIDRELRELIRRMSMENSLWGASRIHGELLMLVSKSLSRWCRNTCKPPSQTWKTFLRNHAEAIAAIDICVEPISKSFEEDDEAGKWHEAKEVLRIKLPGRQECGAAIESRRRTVRPTSVWYIAEVGVHLAWRTCGDWIGAVRPARYRRLIFLRFLCQPSRPMRRVGWQTTEARGPPGIRARIRSQKNPGHCHRRAPTG